MTLPSRPLLLPRTMVTSSSLRMGMLRTCFCCCQFRFSDSFGRPRADAEGALLTLYFSRSSLLRGALMMVRRTLEGALK